MAAPKKPLPDIAALTANPHSPVLIVATAEAQRGAEPLLPDGWLAITWEGAPTKTDWSPINGRPVAIWRDAGLAGDKTAHTIAAALHGRAKIIEPPPGVPDGWNLAAPIPDGIDVAYIITRAIEEAPMPPQMGDDHEPPSATARTAQPAPIAKYRALGHKEGRFYFFSNRTNYIHNFSSKDLRSGNGLRDLEPDDIFWARQPRRARTEEKGSPLDWKYLGDLAIADCYRVGIFKDTNLRARGVWLDASAPHSAKEPTPLIAHLGDKILFNGILTSSMAIDSRYIYPVDEPLLPDAPPDTPALTDDEGSDLRYLCRYLPWVNNTSGDLLAGLIATSCICGALQFRTHGWITGPTASGKSYIMENIIARALDGIALHILGNSTEAGIRRHLSRDARPAIYDEAEGEGQAGKQRRDMIIAFMRASSTETKAKILLGSGGPTGESFPVRAQFILGSVGTALDRATDQTRCLLLTLRGSLPTSDAHRKDLNAKFAEIQEKIAALPEHLSTRLLRRMVPLVHTVRANAELFRRLIAAKHATSRIGDQLGTVLAGTYALEHTDRCSEATAAEFLNNFPWSDYVNAHDTNAADEGNLYNHLCAHYIRVDVPHKGMTIHTVGELAAIAAGRVQSEEGITARMAQTNLGRVGIKYDGNATAFRIATHHQQLNKIFVNAQFQQGYIEILGRVIGASKAKNSDYFGGVGSRYIVVPEDYILGKSIP